MEGEIRADFPIFYTSGNERLVYLDSAATSQKPSAVIEAVASFERMYNANVHRGIYPLSQKATDLFEGARAHAAAFIHASSPEETVFVRGATEALNIIALGLGIHSLNEGDEILLSTMEHHSNIVPWLMLAWKGVRVKFVRYGENGTLDLEDLSEKMNRRTRIVSVTHLSNVLGTVNPVSEIVRIAHDGGALCVVDGAQAVPHMEVNMKEIGCDFYAFSGHKMLAPTGIGVLYGRKEILKDMEPVLGGGEMISEVTTCSATWNELPYKFEAGTPNVSGAIGLDAAISYLERIGMDRVADMDRRLVEYATTRMLEQEDVEIYGPRDPEMRRSLISFNLKGIHGHDVSEILGRQGISIRSGHHCAQPLLRTLNQPSVCRASFYIYNTTEDIDRFAEGLDMVRKVFK